MTHLQSEFPYRHAEEAEEEDAIQHRSCAFPQYPPAEAGKRVIRRVVKLVARVGVRVHGPEPSPSLARIGFRVRLVL